MGVDWGFWVMYLIPLVTGLVGGWWIRGVVETEKVLMEEFEIQQARRRHPSSYERWTDG